MLYVSLSEGRLVALSLTVVITMVGSKLTGKQDKYGVQMMFPTFQIEEKVS